MMFRGILLAIALSSLVAQNRSAGEVELDRALALARRGLTDQAEVAFEFAATRAEEIKDNRLLAKVLLLHAEMKRERGDRQATLNLYLRAMAPAKGTDMEPMVEAQFYLETAQFNLAERNLWAALDFWHAAQPAIAKIQADSTRNSLESRSLTLYTYLCLASVRAIRREYWEQPASNWPDGLQILIYALLREEAPRSAVRGYEKAGKLSADQARWFANANAGKAAILEHALKANEKVTDLDRKRGADLADIEIAKNESQRAEILELLGRYKDAIALKEGALRVFDKHNVFRDGIVALEGLTSLEIANKNIVQGLRWSAELVWRMERQTSALVGQSLVAMLSQVRSSYVRHLYLLRAQHKTLQNVRDPNQQKALNAYLLHADRFNLRAARRDMAVYRELGEEVGADSQLRARFQVLLDKVDASQRERQKAVAQGKSPKDFQAAAGLEIDSPFAESRAAKQDLVTAVEDFKRARVGNTPSFFLLPGNMQDVMAGMTEDEAVIFFHVLQPRPGEAGAGRLEVAVLQGGREARMAELPGATLEKVTELVIKVRDAITVSAREAEEPLRQAAQMLWHPLGDLPGKLTIILTPELIGVPFEALPGKDGTAVVARYSVRYAFGLSKAVGRTIPIGDIRSAMVIGADQFVNRDLESLPQGREEIEAIRRFLGSRQIEYKPTQGLPQRIGPVLTGRIETDLIHIATHSVLDEDEVPLLDRLAFPRDDLAAYDLSLSGLRGRLVVLSACELFRSRRSTLNPVSGLTMAALARVAPQVISGLWKVNSVSTKWFMLRFYDALAAEKDPGLALAIAKRDFRGGSGLAAWAKQSGFTEQLTESDWKEYQQPYHWAPFVLVVGLAE